MDQGEAVAVMTVEVAFGFEVDLATRVALLDAGIVFD